mgnify:CR=1 FL=1
MKVVLVDVFVVRNGGILAPDDLPALVGAVEKALETAGINPRGGAEVIVLSGRLPLWAAAAILHATGHARPAAAQFDPRLQAGVIVMTHSPSPELKLGGLVPLEGDEVKVQVEF